MFEVTEDMVSTALAAAVADKGYNHVAKRYRVGNQGLSCVYVTPGTQNPDCIVGHVFNQWGILHLLYAAPNDTILDLAGMAPNYNDGYAPVKNGIIFHGNSLLMLSAAQSAQDELVTWGHAVKMAESALEAANNSGAVL